MAKAPSTKIKEQWPADSVERVRIDDLVPYARNARTHSDAQVEQMAASMKHFGWTIPVLVDETGGIIAGHGRVLAAQRNGYETAPCMKAVGWSEAKKRAYIIADNKLALNAEWDEQLLRDELTALSDDEFDLSLLGFDAKEIDRLYGEIEAPEFQDLDPENLETNHQCPKCGYEWSGKAK